MLGLVKRLFRKECEHEFSMSNITLSGIQPLPEPSSTDYFLWKEYYKEVYKHDSVTKRIQCSCNKCGSIIYADCGLHLKGKLVR
mgnify:CR=1 FL=1